MKHDKKSASIAFDCSFSNVKAFNVQDPFNDNKALAGFICKQEGMMGGSLILTTVDNIAVEPQLIYSTPKVYYPFKTGTNEFIDNFIHENKPISKVFFNKKWDGVNIIFYKYFDSKGNQFITSKTKGSAILNDCEFGNFLSFCKTLQSELIRSKEYQEFLTNEEAQGISYEMCGYLLPLLVQYNFDLKIFPLFKIYYDGKIVPFINQYSL